MRIKHNFSSTWLQHSLILKQILPEHKHGEPAEEVEAQPQAHHHQRGYELGVLQPELARPEEECGDQHHLRRRTVNEDDIFCDADTDHDNDDAGGGDTQPGEQVGGDPPESAHYQQGVHYDLEEELEAAWIIS